MLRRVTVLALIATLCPALLTAQQGNLPDAPSPHIDAIVERSIPGRQPGTLAALALNREKKTRTVLIEAGYPPEAKPAVTLNAVKEALLRCMPDSEVLAQTRKQLSETAMVPSKETGQKALRELLAEGKIKRIGKGINGDVYRYFLRPDGV